MKQRRIGAPVLLLMLLVLSFGCAKKVTPHPNQINSFDGQAYDALTYAQAALDEAKAQYQKGSLPPGSKDIINAAGAAYETARTSWSTWRDIAQGLKAGDATASQAQLQTDIAQMTAAIAKVVQLITSAKGGK